MKIKKIVASCVCCGCLIFVLSGFVKTDNELQKFTNKVYDGYRKSQISIVLNGTHTVVEDRKVVIKPGKASYIWTAQSDKNGGFNKNYYNPRIVEENGRKYITADGLPEKILVIDENTLATSNEEFYYVDLMK